MSEYLNPFFARAAEHHRDTPQFVATFGAGAIDMLPEQIWDRLVILRSTPGAGKTSLMRTFTVDKLEWARTRTKPSDGLHRQLLERGVIDQYGPLKLGVLVDLDRDYKSLLDLPIDEAGARRLFFRLLDVRIMVGIVRGALATLGRTFPDGLEYVQLQAELGDSRVEALIQRMGGPTGAGIVEYARKTERAVLELLNTLVAIDSDMIPDGHSELYSLAVLADSRISVDGKVVHARPLLMFDDGQALARVQRDALLLELRRRRPSIARWYAERFEALNEQELIGGLDEGRDVLSVNLDEIARNGDGRRFTKAQHERVLADIASRRAAAPLSVYAGETQPFLDLMETDLSDEDFDFVSIVDSLRSRVLTLSGDTNRFDPWFHDADRLSGYQAAVRWRELEVLIHRDQNRQGELFGEALSGEDVQTRSSSSIREAAALALSQEYRLPFYFGPATVTRLGSHNAQQFLNVCGELFGEMLVDVSLGRAPRLSAARQHRVLRSASTKVWESIPRTVPHGRDIQSLVLRIVDIAVENSKPRVPYPPGVTGTALLMAERDQLIDPEYREKLPLAERLYDAIASAVAYNVLYADLERSTKGNRYMVLYLNRLLCPHFGLPLGLGGYKERRLAVMLRWMGGTTAANVRGRSDSGVLDL